MADIHYLYLRRWVMPDGTSWHKVGITNNPARRDREQNVIPAPMETILCIPVGTKKRTRRAEKAIRRKFWRHKVIGCGNRELFRLPEAMVAKVVAMVATYGPGPTAPQPLAPTPEPAPQPVAPAPHPLAVGPFSPAEAIQRQAKRTYRKPEPAPQPVAPPRTWTPEMEDYICRFVNERRAAAGLPLAPRPVLVAAFRQMFQERAAAAGMFIPDDLPPVAEMELSPYIWEPTGIPGRHRLVMRPA